MAWNTKVAVEALYTTPSRTMNVHTTTTTSATTTTNQVAEKGRTKLLAAPPPTGATRCCWTACHDSVDDDARRSELICPRALVCTDGRNRDAIVGVVVLARGHDGGAPERQPTCPPSRPEGVRGGERPARTACGRSCGFRCRPAASRA